MNGQCTFYVGVADPDQYGFTVNLSGWIRIRECSLLPVKKIFLTKIHAAPLINSIRWLKIPNNQWQSYTFLCRKASFGATESGCRFKIYSKFCIWIRNRSKLMRIRNPGFEKSLRFIQ